MYSLPVWINWQLDYVASFWLSRPKRSQFASPIQSFAVWTLLSNVRLSASDFLAQNERQTVIAIRRPVPRFFEPLTKILSGVLSMKRQLNLTLTFTLLASAGSLPVLAQANLSPFREQPNTILSSLLTPATDRARDGLVGPVR